jgi:hypothetical protein
MAGSDEEIPKANDAGLAFFDGRRLDRARFGDASHCQTIGEAVEVLRRSVDPVTRSRAAALAMVLALEGRSGTTYLELRAAQRALRSAKEQVDRAADHAPVVVATTDAIVRAADTFVDEATCPPNEWPTVRELVGRVVHEAEVAHAATP